MPKAANLNRVESPLPLTDQTIAYGENPTRAVEAELRTVEERMLGLLDCREQFISEICRYLVGSGGKRVRPVFILLMYRACGGDDRRIRDAIDVCVALELIHSATLLHDDIIDGGQLRRGKPSAYKRFGLGPTLVAGDFLFSRAFELCGPFEEELIRIAAEACIQLTEGEVMEGRLRFNPAITLDDYRRVIQLKTASLFWAGGKIAALLAGAPSPLVTRMGELGTEIGVIFQMVDDLLDVLGPEAKIGKPVGSDLRAGIPSLPVVLGVERSQELRSLFQSGSAVDGAGFQRALELVSAPEVLAEARTRAAQQAHSARRLLGHLPPSLFRDRIATMVDEQVAREV
jgi:octaprenyl-diphosphate synthase